MFILVLVFLGVTINALATTMADFYDLKPKTGYIVRQIESILPQGIVIAHLRHYDDPSEHHFRDVSETREIDFKEKEVVDRSLRDCFTLVNAGL